MENRIIYNDNSDGRYTVVPVDELHERAGVEVGEDLDLDLGGLGIVGDTVSIPETGAATVGLHSGGEQYVWMDRAGVYG